MVPNSADRAILLTGVNGQVGFELARTLQGLGRIVVADRSVLDLSDFDQVRKVVREVRPTLIVNPAGYTAVDAAESEVDLAMRINGDAPGVLAEEAKRLGAALIHYSTDYVYNGEKAEAYIESDTPDPLNVYGKTKLAGEQAIAASGVDHLVLRTSWVYGAHGKNFFNTMIRLASERPELKIVVDQIGAPTWSNTVAILTAHIVAQAFAADDAAAWWGARSGVYHLTASGATSWYGFASAIFDIAMPGIGPTVLPIASSEYPTPAKRPRNSSMSIDKFEKVFGLRAPRWDDALRIFLEGR